RCDMDGGRHWPPSIAGDAMGAGARSGCCAHWHGGQHSDEPRATRLAAGDASRGTEFSWSSIGLAKLRPVGPRTGKATYGCSVAILADTSYRMMLLRSFSRRAPLFCL